MLKKEEIIYNAESLVSVWLKDKSPNDLVIVLEGDNSCRTVPTTKESCGKDVGELLANYCGDYSLLKVTGFLNGENKIFGEIDIVKKWQNQTTECLH